MVAKTSKRQVKGRALRMLRESHTSRHTITNENCVTYSQFPRGQSAGDFVPDSQPPAPSSSLPEEFVPDSTSSSDRASNSANNSIITTIIIRILLLYLNYAVSDPRRRISYCRGSRGGSKRTQKIDEKLDSNIIKKQSYIWTYNQKRESYYSLTTSKERYLPDWMIAASTKWYLVETAKTLDLGKIDTSQARLRLLRSIQRSKISLPGPSKPPVPLFFAFSFCGSRMRSARSAASYQPLTPCHCAPGSVCPEFLTADRGVLL